MFTKNISDINKVQIKAALDCVKKEVFKYSKYIIAGGVIIFIVTLLMLPLPFVMGIVIDKIIPDKDLFLLIISVVILLSANTICSILNYFQEILFFKLNNKISIDIRLKLFEKICRLPLIIKEQFNTGYLMSRIKDDPNRLTTLFGEKIITVVKQFLILIINFGAIIYLNWRLTILAALLLPLFLFTVHFFGKRVKKQSAVTYEKVAFSSKSLQENIDLIELAKETSRPNFNLMRYLKVIAQAFRSFVSLIKLESLNSNILRFIGALIPISILAFGGYEIISGRFSIGKLVTFTTVLNSVITAATILIGFNIEIQKLVVSLSRVGEILLFPEEHKKKSIELDDIENLEISNLEFSYNNKSENRPEKILNNINLKFQRGTKTGIIGYSGAGKTTLIKILAGLYDFSGIIKLDSHEISADNKIILREKVAIVPQEPILFNDTVYANVAIGKKQATREEVKTALIEARAWEFVEKLPQQELTNVGESGNRFSTGQKQRIAIARALIKKADILILDEATANIDNLSDKYIIKTIDEISKKRIVIIISHRLENIKHCDQILVLERGNIIEQGNHQELMKQNGFYLKLNMK